MNPKILLLATALAAPAQDPFAGSPRGNTPFTENKTMLEDMETMRLVLSRKLNVVATDPNAAQQYWAYDQANTPHVAYPAATQPAAQSYGHALSALAGGTSQSGRLHASAIEALYLPRAGVIYSITMPPVKGDPRGSKDPAPKSEPVTDWDRARNALEGKAAPASPAAPRREAPLAHVLLKALADNGKHFRELRDDESISIVVTFRKSPEYFSAGQGSRFLFGDYVAAQTTPTGQSTMGQPMFGSTSPVGASGGGMPGAPIGGVGGAGPADDDAVAELHIKRGNYAEAIKLYRNALKTQVADADKLSEEANDVNAQRQANQRVRNSYARLLQAMTAAGQFDEAKNIMAQAQQFDSRKKGSQANMPATAPPTLPARLVVSATKRDLVAAGSGKMTLEELAKTATVQYSQPGK